MFLIITEDSNNLKFIEIISLFALLRLSTS